jgi:nucleoside-triphosphatase THEP1
VAGPPEPLLFLVTGSQGAGKTTFCMRLVAAARAAGWRAAGLLSLPVFDGSLRVAIDAEDLASGELRRLAVRSDVPTPGSRQWQFDPETVAWGNRILASSTPVDLLVVDELGPLEFERGSGWQAGLAAVDSRQYAVAVAVVRSELLGEALIRWYDANLVEIDTYADGEVKAKTLSERLF